MSLDDDFGDLVQPWRMGDFEDRGNPVSPMVVDAGTASAPGELMQCVSDGCRIAGFLTGATSFLWLVDGRGEIIFAVEEMLDAMSPGRRVPNLCGIGFADHWHKLGHPSLVAAGPVRSPTADEFNGY